MNRKERRFAEKAQEKKTGFKPAPAAAATKAEALKAEGMALRAAGKEAEAIPLLAEALKLNSALADVHFILAIMARTKPELKVDMAAINRGIKNKLALKDAYKAIQDILRSRKQRAENLICQEEMCRLLPDDNDEKAEYALMLNVAQRREESIKIMADLFSHHPTNKVYKGVFVGLMDHVAFKQFEPEVKKALQLNFDNIYETNLYKALPLWLNIIIHDPCCSGLKDFEKAVTDSEVKQWLSNATDDQLAFTQDRLFLDGLRLLLISDIVLERLLARLRRGLCLHIKSLTDNGSIHIFENFLFALGEQSFFNEYIYAQPDDEKAIIEDLVLKIKADQLGDIKPEYAYGLVSCYQPLHQTFAHNEKELRHLADNSAGFAKLFKTQFLDIQEEQILKSRIPNFGMLENAVSKNVQSQYEEHPYPRWVSCVNYPLPSNLLPMEEKDRRHTWRILVAGCGTGRHAIGTAATYPNAHVTAVDLSLSSLAYAQRKANESGLADRIDFIHADILNMGKWPDQFDIIESSGVLHHMEDPFKGWQILTERLKDGGYFKLGFYSEIARAEVVKTREYIKSMGFPSTLEGIRTCREMIIQRPSNDSLRQWMLKSGDFYTTSSLRDLIFHVQEQRMNLPQLQGMMDQLGLTCIKFHISEVRTAYKYNSLYPDDPERKNLLNWDEFEKKNPDTFNAMYQFWCQKH